MLSRVAENLYWFGRYVQRAENTARLINVNANLMLDLPRRMPLGWAPLIEITGAEAAFKELYDEATEENVVRFLMIDPRNPGSIVSSLNNAREILRVSRDTMPRDTWERLNDIYFYVQERGESSILRTARQAFVQQVISGALLVYSVLTTNMSRDVGFQFLRIGTNIEQADMTTRILDVRTLRLNQNDDKLDLTPFENIVWMSVLRSLTAYQMYRRHLRTRVNGNGVVRFLLQNRDFPRSAMFCLDNIASTLPHLPNSRSIERTIDRTRGLVRDANIEGLMKTAMGVPDLMDEIQIGLNDLHTALADAYFSQSGS
ncbi:alpha-E domain-containing protein [Nevskia sp.]|uniref:alpha-E domain-containing protein n=1 Tax=Nevskia sp. TaxID=1929292 RepID=UPI0025F7B0B8|nr:alpha-E domain-containing protein [Nevskia sp.]